MEPTNNEIGSNSKLRWLVVGGVTVAVAILVVVLVVILRSRAGVQEFATSSNVSAQPSGAAVTPGAAPAIVCGDRVCDHPTEDDQNCPADCLNAVPVVHSVGYLQVSPTSINLNWRTNVPATCVVEYGETEKYGQQLPVETQPTFEHVATVEGLKAGALYYFRIQAQDAQGRQFSAVTVTELAK